MRHDNEVNLRHRYNREHTKIKPARLAPRPEQRYKSNSSFPQSSVQAFSDHRCMITTPCPKRVAGPQVGDILANLNIVVCSLPDVSLDGH